MRRLLLLGLLAAAGCDRAELAPVGTELLVSDPDLGVVFLDSDLRVRLEPAGPSGPLTLRIRDKEIDFDSTQGAFIYEKVLQRGLNVYPLTVTDLEGTVTFDTLFAVYYPARIGALVSADNGTARAGASLAPSPRGVALATGGIGTAGTALATASVLREVGPQILSEEVPLLNARTGHTATPLFGGTLLMGGATVSTPTRAADFVRPPEWIDDTGTTQPVTVANDATPARAGHVARVVQIEGEFYVTLYGGVASTSQGVSASGTIDVYRAEIVDQAVRLVRLTPGGGAGGFPILVGHALAETSPTTAAIFGISGDAGLSLEMTWSTPGTGDLPFSVGVRETAPLRAPRTGAVALDAGGGVTIVIGGRGLDGDPVQTIEAYAEGRAFRFPSPIELVVPRSDHVATIFGERRIAIGGGRPASGGPIVAFETIEF